jgi:hypothetical protein
VTGTKKRPHRAGQDEDHDPEQSESTFDFVLRMIALVAICWLVYFAYMRL